MIPQKDSCDRHRIVNYHSWFGHKHQFQGRALLTSEEDELFSNLINFLSLPQVPCKKMMFHSCKTSGGSLASKSHLLLSEESTGRSDKNSKSCLALRHLPFLSGQAGAPPTLIKGLMALLSRGASLPTPSLNALLSLLQLPCLWVGVATEDVLKMNHAHSGNIGQRRCCKQSDFTVEVKSWEPGNSVESKIGSRTRIVICKRRC